MHINKTLATLFTEVFEGVAPGEDGTWFVQGGEALEETLAGLTANQASQRLGSASSIAAHAIHVIHYLQMSNAYARGEAFEADCEASWRQQTVSAEQWADVQAQLIHEKKVVLELINEPDLTDDAVFGAVANIAHAAYHLGAIRQMVNATRG